MTNKINVSIVGGAGYTAGELLRILIHHPMVNISSVYSTSNAGNPVTKVHDDLFGETDIVFSDKIDENADVVFLCLGHGKSAEFLQNNTYSANTKIIDLSNDFRFIFRAIIYKEHNMVTVITFNNTGITVLA